MDDVREPASDNARADQAAGLQPDRGGPELDLDRLVWDPEYRAAMRPWLAGER